MGVQVFLALLPFACSSDTLVDPAPLEHELMVVWVALERGDTAVQQRYLASARKNWRAFRNTYRSGPLSKEEQGAIFMADLWLLALKAAVDNGHSSGALNHLRRLHRTLSTVRIRTEGEHPVDRLYDFRTDWQWVLEISEDQMMCLLDWPEYADAFRTANKHWQRYQLYPPTYAGTALPGLGRHAERAEHAARALTEELAAFERDLLAANHGPMGAAARAVHSRFIEYLTVAVDYPLPAAHS
jgi:hypothetical protein